MTASRASATRLRDALALRLGVAANGPLARTVTSFAFEIVRARAALLGELPPRLLTGGEQDLIIRDLLAGHEDEGAGPRWPDALTADVRRLRGFRTELRELMTRATESAVRPDRLVQLGAAFHHEEWVAAGQFIREYQQVVDQFPGGGFLDAAELVAEASHLVRAGEVPITRRLIIVDDLQEATRSTLTFLAAFAARGVSVVAFGDPDVATGTFRGATVGAIGRLAAELGVADVPTLALAVAHRQGPRLRALTSRVTGRIGVVAPPAGRAATAGRADDAAVPQLIEIVASSAPEQYARVARCLRARHLNSAVPWSAMLVVVRSTSLVPVVARALAPRRGSRANPGRRSRPSGGLRGASPAARGRGRAAARRAHAERRGRPAARTARRDGCRRPSSPSPRAAAGGAARRKFPRQRRAPGRGARLGGRVRDHRHPAVPGWRRSSRPPFAPRGKRALDGASIEELLWSLWSASGLAEPWSAQAMGVGLAAEEANRNLDGVVALFTAAKRFVEREPGAAPSTFVSQLLDAEVPEDTLAPQPSADAVLVATPSGALGLEVDTVAVSASRRPCGPTRGCAVRC
ncbi:MAG: UvrD-helicase domain-containing protein [Galbitalea sp.]